MFHKHLILEVCFAVLAGVSGLFKLPYCLIVLAVGIIGWTASFLTRRAKIKRLLAYWDRCKKMCSGLNASSSECLDKGDLDGSISCTNRCKRILALWDASLHTNSIPEGPDLDDL